jgi:sporulation protein YlmC with PRC-barrel domain
MEIEQMRLSKITRLEARKADGAAVGQVTGAILDIPDRRIAYWLVDLDRRGAGAPVWVSAARVRLDGEAVIVDAAPEALERARDRARAREDDSVDLRAIPDLVTGPFGYTVSPSAMAAFLGTWLNRRHRDDIPVPAGAPDGWVRARDVLGKPVFGPGGEIGTLVDVVVQAPESGLTEVLLRTTEGDGTWSLPIEALRHVPRGASHFVVRGAFGAAQRRDVAA